MSPTGPDDMNANLGVLEYPFPLLLTVHAGTGFIAAEQPTAAQAREDFGDAIVQTDFNGLEQVGQAPFTDPQAKHLDKERGQPLITDRMRVPQVRRRGSEPRAQMGCQAPSLPAPGPHTAARRRHTARHTVPHV